MKTPFPYFGAKSRVAAEVWQRFGHVNNYIEPFCGSMAMLLHRAEPTTYETVNDLDGLLTNFWRALKHDPEAIADLCAAPPSEIDITARHNWVYRNKERIVEMQSDPEAYDVKAAAYWVYCRCNFIGGRGIFDEKIGSRVPALGTQNHGINWMMRDNTLLESLAELSSRLQRVRICCGDWRRVLTNTPLTAASPTAVFLDPPYQAGEYYAEVYRHATDVFDDVKAWCIENGNNTNLRIALCGYDSNEMPDDWEVYSWSTGGGMANTTKNKDSARGLVNRHRETIWFSPYCLNGAQGVLL
jgi:DNA adenine methylase